MRRSSEDVALFEQLSRAYGLDESSLVRFALRYLERHGPMRPREREMKTVTVRTEEELRDALTAAGLTPSPLPTLPAQVAGVRYEWIHTVTDRDTMIERLENELYQKTTPYMTAIELFPAGRSDRGNEYNAWVIEIVTLDPDGDTIAYRSSNDTEDADWQLGQIPDAVEEAITIWEGIRESETHDMWIVLTQTAHGKPYWLETYDPDLVKELDTYNAMPRRVFGPYPVGPNGYASTAEAFSHDDSAPDLDDPSTWFTDEPEE